MAKSATATGTAGGGKNGVLIVVAGDRGTGKSSLIVTAAADTFPSNVPPVLPPTRMPEDFYPDRVPITIVDTSSKYILISLLCCVDIYTNVCETVYGMCLIRVSRQRMRRNVLAF